MAQPVKDHLKRKRTVSFEATDFDLDFKQYNSDHWRSNIILRWRGDSERGKNNPYTEPWGVCSPGHSAAFVESKRV